MGGLLCTDAPEERSSGLGAESGQTRVDRVDGDMARELGRELFAGSWVPNIATQRATKYSTYLGHDMVWEDSYCTRYAERTGRTRRPLRGRRVGGRGGSAW